VSVTQHEPPTRRAGPAYVLPEPFRYRLKKKLLGEPLITERLADEKLGKLLAVGVLSPDMISSTAYGTEEMLNQLVPYIGLAAFSLLLPINLAILVVLFFVTMSYREIVMVYTKAGGSYVVSRDNFGPKVAQVAAVALIIDYILTVAVQNVAGTDALVSAVDIHGKLVLSHWHLPVIITVAVIAFMVWGNLRGIREAGKIFALPTYLFVFGIGSLVVVGLVRAVLGKLHAQPIPHSGVLVGHAGSGLLLGASVLVVLRAFANGGVSLTGLEAISNGVATLRDPRGPNARRVQVFTCSILGTLVLGVSLIAKITHAVPYISGLPTVLSQEAHFVFGYSAWGTAAYWYIQAVSMLILWTGGNTSFNGFPNLTSFVAEDAYLPNWLTRRGHRLVFSNGIIVLGVLATALVLATGANLSALVALYAIGVFVGFTMAGAGMVKHHLTNKEPGWRYKIWINGFASVLSFTVVGILAVVKFAEGAWLVVVMFPLLIFTLLRLHKQYEEEKAELEENAPRAAEAPVLRRHVVIVFVERLDLATARALQYARTLQPDELRSVHFVLDTAVAHELEAQWTQVGLSRLPLDIVECPDRRLVRAAMEFVAEAAEDGQTEVTVVLPRRGYESYWSRILHDRTADHLAAYVGQLPNANATIIPFPLGRRRKMLVPWKTGGVDWTRSDGADAIAPAQAAAVAAAVQSEPRAPAHPWFASRGAASRGGAGAGTGSSAGRDHAGAKRRDDRQSIDREEVPGAVRISELRPRQRARVTGRIRAVRVQAGAGVPSVECTIADSTGQVMLVFQGRRRVPGIEPGARLVVEGMVGERGRRLAMINPLFTILRTAETSETPPPARGDRPRR
jgi:amino acid transporter